MKNHLNPVILVVIGFAVFSDEDLDDFYSTLAAQTDSSLSSSFVHDLEVNSSDEAEKLALSLPG